jgi:hypothetical protein
VPGLGPLLAVAYRDELDWRKARFVGLAETVFSHFEGTSCLRWKGRPPTGSWGCFRLSGWSLYLLLFYRTIPIPRMTIV